MRSVNEGPCGPAAFFQFEGKNGARAFGKVFFCQGVVWGGRQGRIVDICDLPVIFQESRDFPCVFYMPFNAER